MVKQDSEANELTPTALMDRIWRAAVSDTNLYGKLHEQIDMKLHSRPAAMKLSLF